VKKPNIIGIIGGTGRMGQWFEAFFENMKSSFPADALP